MKKNYSNYFFLGACLVLIPGCGRVIDWVTDSFYQGDDLAQPSTVAKRYTRSVVLYDQLDTVGMFDALWLADEVREAYVRMYGAKHRYKEEQYKQFLDRQLEENAHFVVMYVLALESIGSVPLTDKKRAMWTLSLRIGDTYFMPFEIKQVDLKPEYKDLFGDKVSKFKTAYIVRFKVQDPDGNMLVHKGLPEIALHVRSTMKEAQLVWRLDGDMRAREEHRVYTECGEPVSIHISSRPKKNVKTPKKVHPSKKSGKSASKVKTKKGAQV